MAFGVLLLIGCSFPAVEPAPPPGTEGHEESPLVTEGLDGSVWYFEGNKRSRNVALRKAREYCAGPYEVIREEVKSKVTAASFPFPERRHYLYFRCGTSDGSPE
jgi:hypothetical protein